MSFRDQLIATLRAIRPVLEEPGVLVVGSEVPNLLEERVASTLVVSRDVDVGIPVARHGAVKSRLPEIEGLRPSRDEPSVWVPERQGLLEVNFVGLDPLIREAAETYVLEDPELPLLVFGTLSLLRPGVPIEVEGLSVPVPRTAGLLLEKLVTDRSGEKGERDLLVAIGLLLLAQGEDLDELETTYRELPSELRYAVRSNLTILSLMEPHSGMPDPRPHRANIRTLLLRLESGEEDLP